MSVPNAVMRWKDLAQKYVLLDPILTVSEILAIIWTESSGNPSAVNESDPSWGLMQVTRLIAHAYGHFSEDDTSWHFDPDKNMLAGCSFLADLKDKYSKGYPNWVTGYNQGERNLQLGHRDQPYWDAFEQHKAAIEQALAEPQS